MGIPFHTKHCREFWGCHSSCPVMELVKDRDRLKIIADELTLKLHKKTVMADGDR